MVKEHPPSDKEIRDLINSQKGLSEGRKRVLIEKSEQTWFRQYTKDSHLQLKKLTKTVKGQVIKFYDENGEYYDKKGVKIDKRGIEPPKQKGTTKPQLDKKLKEEKPKEIPIVITKVKKQNKPEVPKEIREKISKEKRAKYRKAYNQRPEVKEANRIRKAEASKKKKGE